MLDEYKKPSLGIFDIIVIFLNFIFSGLGFMIIGRFLTGILYSIFYIVAWSIRLQLGISYSIIPFFVLFISSGHLGYYLFGKDIYNFKNKWSIKNSIILLAYCWAIPFLYMNIQYSAGNLSASNYQVIGGILWGSIAGLIVYQRANNNLLRTAIWIVIVLLSNILFAIPSLIIIFYLLVRYVDKPGIEVGKSEIDQKEEKTYKIKANYNKSESHRELSNHLRILVVESELGISKSLEAILDMRKNKIITFSNGSVGLEGYEGGKYDLAFIDLRLPLIGGMSLLQRFKKIDPNLEIVIMTDCPTEESRANAFKFGALGYLEIPLNNEHVYKYINKVIELKQNKLRILVVDDEPAVIECFKMILKLKDYDVDCFSDGPSCLDYFEIGKYDVAFVDEMLPYMGGIELLKRLKEVDPNLEVIIQSTYASETAHEKAIQLGALEYLQVPFKMEEIYELVDRGKKIRFEKGVNLKNPEKINIKEQLKEPTKNSQAITKVGPEMMALSIIELSEGLFNRLIEKVQSKTTNNVKLKIQLFYELLSFYFSTFSIRAGQFLEGEQLNLCGGSILRYILIHIKDTKNQLNILTGSALDTPKLNEHIENCIFYYIRDKLTKDEENMLNNHIIPFVSPKGKRIDPNENYYYYNIAKLFLRISGILNISGKDIMEYMAIWIILSVSITEDWKFISTIEPVIKNE